MPDTATDLIKAKKLLFESPQKGEPCLFCSGTMYWEYPEGRECVKCKHFYKKTP